MAEVERIFVCLVHRFPMREMDEGQLLAEKGFQGCIHGRHGSSRQVLMMDAETLEVLGLEPGTVKENITTRGFDLAGLNAGNRLQVGDALLEATAPCHPCHRMEEIRAGLQEVLRGRRGWLFRVVEGGTVRRGDRIQRLTQTLARLAGEKERLRGGKS